MTDLLDPPTSQRTDFSDERWEVETSLPVSVTGEAPNGIDFVIMSHAEQAVGDFPIEVDDPEILFNQIAEFARTQIGIERMAEGYLIDRGVVAYVVGPGSTGVPPTQALYGLLAGFVADGAGIRRMAQRRVVEDILADFPVPVFGSPPNAWQRVGQVLGSGSGVAFTGYTALDGQLMLAIIGGGVTLAFWFLTPHARVTRRWSAQKWADRLGVQLRPEDEE